jgi:hypothetical protein
VSPADNEVTSVAGAGASIIWDGTGFATKHWSLALGAQGESPEADKEIELNNSVPQILADIDDL